MNTIKSILILLVISIYFLSCSTQREATFIRPPAPNLDIPFFSYEINANNTDTILLDNGGSIVIPGNCLVDERGNKISGKVQINYREFHDGSDILLSGIPMTYDSAGISMNFESAGMFEIDAQQNGYKVYVADNGQISVTMGCNIIDSDYNFYRLDTVQGNWFYKGSPKVEDNPKKTEALKALKNLQSKPIPPKKKTRKTRVINLNVDYSLFPEFKNFHAVMWEYAGKKDENNPHVNKWIYSENWSGINLTSVKGIGKYTIELNNFDKSFSMDVWPVFSGKDYKKAMHEFNKKLTAYESDKEDRIVAEQTAQVQSTALRSFRISGFGIYNYDRQYKIADKVDLVADFVFDKKVKVSMEELEIFLITGENGTVVVKYPKCDWDKVALSASEESKFVTFLPDGRIAVHSSAELKKADFWDKPTNKRIPHTFTLKVMDKPIASSDIKSSITSN